jgi:hypothetical protein
LEESHIAGGRSANRRRIRTCAPVAIGENAICKISRTMSVRDLPQSVACRRLPHAVAVGHARDAARRRTAAGEVLGARNECGITPGLAAQAANEWYGVDRRGGGERSMRCPAARLVRMPKERLGR